MAAQTHIELQAMTISSDEQAFFASLGERVTQLRKGRNITQVQLAETLGVSQQTIQAYEVGRRMARLDALTVPPVSEDEIEAEVQAARLARRAQHDA